jgi:hypothetical protein
LRLCYLCGSHSLEFGNLRLVYLSRRLCRFVGKYQNSKYVAGTGLALTWINVTGATGVGALGAMQTLVPQAIGDKNFRMVWFRVPDCYQPATVVMLVCDRLGGCHSAAVHSCVGRPRGAHRAFLVAVLFHLARDGRTCSRHR